MTDDFEGNVLPDFPVDEHTLDLLWTAMHPGPDAERSSVGDFLRLMAELGGSDVTAVAEVIDDGSDGGAAIHLMRDMQYHEHNVMTELVKEIRRLRSEVESLRGEQKSLREQLSATATLLEAAAVARDEARANANKAWEATQSYRATADEIIDRLIRERDAARAEWHRHNERADQERHLRSRAEEGRAEVMREWRTEMEALTAELSSLRAYKEEAGKVVEAARRFTEAARNPKHRQFWRQPWGEMAEVVKAVDGFARWAGREEEG